MFTVQGRSGTQTFRCLGSKIFPYFFFIVSCTWLTNMAGTFTRRFFTFDSAAVGPVTLHRQHGNQSTADTRRTQTPSTRHFRSYARPTFENCIVNRDHGTPVTDRRFPKSPTPTTQDQRFSILFPVVYPRISLDLCVKTVPINTTQRRRPSANR